MHINNFYGKRLFLLMVTDIRVHYDWEAWQSAAGMVAGTGSESLHLLPQTERAHWTQDEAINSSSSCLVMHFLRQAPTF